GVEQGQLGADDTQIEAEQARLDAVARADVVGEADEWSLTPCDEHEIDPARRKASREGRADAFGGAGDDGPRPVALAGDPRMLVACGAHAVTVMQIGSSPSTRPPSVRIASSAWSNVKRWVCR